MIAPVELLIDNPAVELYTPPAVPASVTLLEARDVQNGLPEYDIVAEGQAANASTENSMAMTLNDNTFTK